MPSPYRVLGVGEILWDLQPHGKQLGGAPGNFAFHVNAQGIPAAPVSAVGEDELGRQLLARLEGKGVSIDHVAVLNDVPTSTVDVELDAGKPTYTIHEDVAWDRIPMSDRLLEAAAAARCVCFGSLAQRDARSRETIRQVLDATRPDCLRVFDVNLRQSFYDRDIVDGGLRRATLFKLSDEEVPEVARLLDMPDTPTAFEDAVFEAYVDLGTIAITRGGEGSTVRRRDGGSSEQPTVKGEVVSTVGAGDSFTAGLVSGLLKGRPLAEAHAFATELASFVVSQPGAMPDVPAGLRL
jgi:fructokinase